MNKDFYTKYEREQRADAERTLADFRVSEEIRGRARLYLQQTERKASVRRERKERRVIRACQPFHLPPSKSSNKRVRSEAEINRIRAFLAEISGVSGRATAAV